MKKVEVFETEDGELHRTEQEAAAHERRLRVQAAAQRAFEHPRAFDTWVGVSADSQGDSCLYCHNMADFLSEPKNRERLLVILEAKERD
jgi:hypothetical protein